MKGAIVLCFGLVWNFASVIQASAQTLELNQVMVQEVGDIDRSTLSSIKSQNALLHTAVGNLLGVGYIKHAVVEAVSTLQNPEYVLMATALSKNSLGYYEYYIQLSLRERGVRQPDFTFHMIYQDTSTQGNHGPARQADWMVLKPSSVDSTWRSVIADLEFEPIQEPESYDFVQLAFKSSRAFQKYGSEINENTISSIHWRDLKNNTRYAVVSFMTKNIDFVTQSRSVSVIFRQANGKISMADDVWMASQFLKPLETIVTKEESEGVVQPTDFTQHALERARLLPMIISSQIRGLTP